MGEECPLPESDIFQRTLFVSLQWIGGFARGATPLADGPRHCGQDSRGASQVPTPDGLVMTEAQHEKLSTVINCNERVIILYTGSKSGPLSKQRLSFCCYWRMDHGRISHLLPKAKSGLLTRLPKLALAVSVLKAAVKIAARLRFSSKRTVPLSAKLLELAVFRPFLPSGMPDAWNQM